MAEDEKVEPTQTVELRGSRINRVVGGLYDNAIREFANHNFGLTRGYLRALWLVVHPDPRAEVLATNTAYVLRTQIDEAEESWRKAVEGRRRRLRDSGSHESLKKLGNEKIADELDDRELGSERFREELSAPARELTQGEIQSTIGFLEERIQEGLDNANYGDAAETGIALQLIAHPSIHARVRGMFFLSRDNDPIEGFNAFLDKEVANPQG